MFALLGKFFKFSNYENFFKFGKYRKIWKVNILKFLNFEYVKKVLDFKNKNVKNQHCKF